ncbi:hypothetical protein CANINC_001309 [Pichia inconspicua]|uniref:Protein URE2 n=1 Tax=Pichia inconspicua TaxID=52247 RepID=A0A4T0X591_9ASCO|nr:hypothetical protein CANINC_001309 [[Candida] inconspicua]
MNNNGYPMTHNHSQNVSNLSAGLRNIHLTQDDQHLNQNDQFYNNSLQNRQFAQNYQQNQQERGENNETGQSNLQLQPVDDSSELRAFFSRPMPNEGFSLITHRSAPNGFKIAIILSELNYNYQTIHLDFNKNDHRLPQFLQLNPNGRVPALIDHMSNNNPADNKNNKSISLWESGSIIVYLVNKKWKNEGICPELWSEDLIEQSQILSWLFFQTSGHAPMIGQALHFRYFHTVNVPSAIDRYTDEVRRVYGVLEMALSERREALIMELDSENAQSYSMGLTPMSQSRYFDSPVWLVGERCTIADLCFVPWNYVVDKIGIDLKAEFPEVYKWTKRMMHRPAVLRALTE